MLNKKGPLFVMRTEMRQLRVGKRKEPVAVLEIREPGALQGQELVLTTRDLDFLNFGIAWMQGPACQRAFAEWRRLLGRRF